MGSVRIGQGASAFLDRAPRKLLKAHVIAIDTAASFTPENIYFKDDRVRQVFGVKWALIDRGGLRNPACPPMLKLNSKHHLNFKVQSMGMDYAIRALTVEDEKTLWTMLMYAAHEPSLEAVQRQSCLTRYVQGWGRIGDMGFVACVGELSIGAGWVRLWPMDDRGFGGIDDVTPELAMAVLPDYRGQGVGTQLLSRILAAAQGLFPAICLSVRAENPVANLYQRAGFTKVEGSEVVNRTGGLSFTMVRQFSP